MKQRIIYVMGAGRSGTTLLDIILGNAEGVASCGELNRYPKRGGIPTGFPENSPRLNFWKKFTQNFNYRNSLKEFQQLSLQYEYHSSFIKFLLGKKSKSEYENYASILKKFYAQLFDSRSESTLIESSKYPGRAWQLAQFLPYEISYIYIRRNPVGVVNSFAKKGIPLPPKAYFPANLYYLTVNLLCQYMARKLRKKHTVVTISFEELIQQPKKVLSDLGKQLHLDLTIPIQKIEQNEALEVGDLFEGNNIRLKPQVKFRKYLPNYPLTIANRFTFLLNGWLYKKSLNPTR